MLRLKLIQKIDSNNYTYVGIALNWAPRVERKRLSEQKPNLMINQRKQKDKPEFYAKMI